MAILRRSTREERFFDLFRAAGENILGAAGLLESLLAEWPDDEQGRARLILQAEHDGDRITHDIIHLLNTSAGAPLAREDVFALATAIDDVVDYIEEVADFLGLYKIEAPMDQAQALATTLHAAARNLCRALAALAEPDGFDPYLVEIHRLETQGDALLREGLASLFAGGIDPMLVIRWKDVFERLEQAIDACAHAAHILGGIAVKRT